MNLFKCIFCDMDMSVSVRIVWFGLFSPEMRDFITVSTDKT